MSIVRWSPLRELEEMRRDLDKLFGEFVEPSTRRRFFGKAEERGVFMPNVDMYERKGDVIIKIDLPGVEKEDIDLTITKDNLTVKAESKKEEDVKNEDYYIAERNNGTYNRTIQLPQDVDSTKAKASYKHGVLEIVIPKKEEAKTTEIKVDIT